jgi:hypothetical protein
MHRTQWNKNNILQRANYEQRFFDVLKESNDNIGEDKTLVLSLSTALKK